MRGVSCDAGHPASDRASGRRRANHELATDTEGQRRNRDDYEQCVRQLHRHPPLTGVPASLSAVHLDHTSRGEYVRHQLRDRGVSHFHSNETI